MNGIGAGIAEWNGASGKRKKALLIYMLCQTCHLDAMVVAMDGKSIGPNVLGVVDREIVLWRLE